MAKTRTFIAVEAVDGVLAQAQQVITRLRPLAGQVKWVEPENLHWTLQFLGDLSDEEIAEVCRRVMRLTQRLEPFAVTTLGVGVFPRAESPRVLWLGLGEGSEQLTQLQGTIQADLEDLGFRGDARKFVPHLTLGRVSATGVDQAAIRQALEELAQLPGGHMSVDEVTVFASRLARTGATYLPLAHARLG